MENFDLSKLLNRRRRYEHAYEYFQLYKKSKLPKNSVAFIYDLEGFSRFFNQPDVQDYVPKFLNHVSEAVGICLFKGTSYWMGEEEDFPPLGLRVVHEKFMGDGALYILLPPSGEADFDTENLSTLCNRLWNLKNRFASVVSRALEDVPVLKCLVEFGSVCHVARSTS